MNSNISVIKTLPHVIPLFINKEDSITYITSFSDDALRLLDATDQISKSELIFTKVIHTLANQKSEEVDNEYLAKYKQDIITYNRVEKVQELLDFSVKGDVISVWIPGHEHPIRMEFFGEECESISIFDELTGKSLQEISYIIFPNYLPRDRGVFEIYTCSYGKKENFRKCIFTQKDLLSIEKVYVDINFSHIDTNVSYAPLFYSHEKVITSEIQKFKDKNYTILIATQHKKDLSKNLQDLCIKSGESHTIAFEIPRQIATKLNASELKDLPAGFVSEKAGIVLITDRELYGSIFLNKIKGKSLSSNRIKKLLAQFEGEIQIEDYIVHEDYGIGQYKGLKQETYDESTQDYLLIEFGNKDELYVPLNQIEKITKYLNNSDLPPKLTKLSKGSWKKLKDKVKKTTFLLAKDMLQHLAQRELSHAQAVSNKDSADYKSFLEEFPYKETRDQIQAINEVIQDLESDKPMNRLLVGDVGFGKTEVVMRGIFKIIEAGGQAALLSPTTVLVAQHYQVFKERFKSFPISIAYLSRFNTSKENRKIIDQVNAGEIDIVIGTHRLLQSDITFKNLQFLVVDEEQKFGVKQKEKIKQINYGAHVLSVSATPIPRTLSLALASIQDISLITTPPVGRQPIHTEIIFQSWDRAVNAIAKEKERDGQVYFLHNRVESIQATTSKLERMMPGVSFHFAHGQMSATELDRIITDFYLHKFDVLVCTTIIESGLDLPNVNTMIINDSHRLGLSQLYQLRGRVGRSERQAYCYLMAPTPSAKLDIEHVNEDQIGGLTHKELIEMKKKQQKRKLYLQRLETLVENNALGSGFQLASKDLEIRGAGSILGEKQHGHITAIGYALYIEMLAHEIEKIRNNE